MAKRDCRRLLKETVEGDCSEVDSLTAKRLPFRLIVILSWKALAKDFFLNSLFQNWQHTTELLVDSLRL